MCYLLLFPRGEHRWHYDMTNTRVIPSGDALERKQRISMREYITHLITYRGGFHALLRSNWLFQQYIVDAFVRIKRMMLQWQRHNQEKLCVDSYKELQDYLLGEAAERHVQPGKVIVLSLSFLGSPRHMNACTWMPWPFVKHMVVPKTSLHSLSIPNGMKSIQYFYPVKYVQIILT